MVPLNGPLFEQRGDTDGLGSQTSVDGQAGQLGPMLQDVGLAPSPTLAEMKSKTAAVTLFAILAPQSKANG